MKKIISILLLSFLNVCLVLSFAGCEKNDEKKANGKTLSKEISFSYFNTASSISSYGDTSNEKFEEYVKIADKTLGRYHKLFDIYYEYSGINNIKTINKNAGVAPVKVDRELVDFLLYCKELYALTNGKTNVMLGSVLKIWHDAREDASDNYGYLEPEALPGTEELASANMHTSIDLLIINEAECEVYISDPLASLDVGAVAKGYAVEILYEKLKSEGADSVALNVGGNIRTIGLKPADERWITGITNPDRNAESSIKCRIKIGDSSIVTSGDYERYFVVGEKKYHHIIDSQTLMPADYFSSVTIVTKDSGFADALSTALFCMSYEEGVDFVKSLEGVDVIWIFKDGRLEHTEGITFAN